jgi:hypothetical protein
MKLHDIRPGLSLSGVEATQVVSIVATVPQGDGALQLIYRTPDGAMKERVLLTADEQTIHVATVKRPFPSMETQQLPKPLLLIPESLIKSVVL